MSSSAVGGPVQILVVGDSHTALFAGVEKVLPAWPEPPSIRGPFEVHHVGPGLAASLVERESTNRTRAKCLEILAARDAGRIGAAVFCFGEIDCRFHIQRRLRNAGGNPAALQRAIDVTVYRYLSFLLEVAMGGYRPVAFGPVATSRAQYDEPYPWPTIGTAPERNAVTRLFTERLSSECARHGIGFVSILDSLVDAEGLTRDEWYFDGVHLSQAAWPLVAAAFAMQAPDLAGLITCAA